MTATTDSDIARGVAKLEADGYLLVPNALDPALVQKWRECLYRRFEMKQYDGHNSVGNVYIESLLKDEPDLTRPLIGHASMAPFLKAFLGKQTQLRSLRAHLNPGPYTQEWHLDFYGYWDQEKSSGGSRALRGLAMNTTFYLTDNTPETGRLTFLNGYANRSVPEEFKSLWHYTNDRNNPFQAWCDKQPQTHLHPRAGDAVVFFSHVPHQGAKLADPPGSPIRCNVVLHYQQNPMYPGAYFVSRPNLTLDAIGYDATFPFA